MILEELLPSPEVPTKDKPIPVCFPVPLCSTPRDDRKLNYCPLLSDKPMSLLLQQLAVSHPFKKLDLEALLRQYQGTMKVILLGEDRYYVRQAAVYLATIAQMLRNVKTPQEESPRLPDDLAFLLAGNDEDEFDPVVPYVKNAITVIGPERIDPTFKAKPSPFSSEDFTIDLVDFPTSAFLLTADAGTVLNRRIVQACSDALKNSKSPCDFFIALRHDQVDIELLEELRFTCGFHVSQVGSPDQDHFDRYLRQHAEERLLTLSPKLDTRAVIANLRRYRGPSFQETDIDRLLDRVLQQHPDDTPLTLKDLTFEPAKLGHSASDEFREMVGLTGVKEKLRRILARIAMDRREDSTCHPCMNLAFAGPPGTGKSVTARLIAKLLREEGCGTGRFVEAGREQLIGRYVGHTSPLIANLFAQARGGVLFIDEVGALLDDSGHDSYAAEAVNALVRHMEIEPETMVIFATYPDEMEQFLSLNPGLKSRVSQIVNFAPYTDEELWQILNLLGKKNGRSIPQDAKEICLTFLRKLRTSRGESFGNGREARRLLQAAEEELALRRCDDPTAILSTEDFTRAAVYLQDEEPVSQNTIGYHI